MVIGGEVFGSSAGGNICICKVKEVRCLALMWAEMPEPYLGLKSDSRLVE